MVRDDWRFLRLHVPLRWRTAEQYGAGSGPRRTRFLAEAQR
jgi:hypothetical protein